MLRRIGAYFIDWYIITVLLNVGVMAYTYLRYNFAQLNLTLDYFTAGESLVVLGLLVIINTIYFVILPSFVFEGQTIGKKIMKLVVVNFDDKKTSALQLLIRDLVGVELIEECIYPLSNYGRNALTLFLGEENITYLVYISAIVGLISIGIAIFTKDHRMIHDYIAKTKVIGSKASIVE